MSTQKNSMLDQSRNVPMLAQIEMSPSCSLLKQPRLDLEQHLHPTAIFETQPNISPLLPTEETKGSSVQSLGHFYLG